MTHIKEFKYLDLITNLICFCPCIINVSKVIQKNQLDATITIYWSLRSAQHVSGTTMPIIRRSRVLYSGCCLWYLVL